DRKSHRIAHVAADGQLVTRRVDHRDVEMDQEVVEADRRDVVTQRLERHRVITHRELQLRRRYVGARVQCSGGPGPAVFVHLDRASLEVMQERSEEQIISRLLELENDGQAERRAQLTGERYLTLLHDPDSGRSYIVRHGSDSTEGAEIPQNTEFYEYPATDVAQRAYDQLLDESRRAGELVEDDSSEGIGDFESGGAEIRDLYADSDEDELTRDPVISEEEQP